MMILAAGALILPSYAHEVRDRTVMDGRIAMTYSEVRVFDTKSGKTVWRRRFAAPSIAWSSDRRTIGILDGEVWTTWRAGGRVKQVVLARQLSGEVVDESSMKWSPNGTRILVIGPMTQGESILNIGRLSVLTAGSSRVQRIADNVNHADWIGLRRVRYEVWDYREGGDILKMKKELSIR